MAMTQGLGSGNGLTDEKEQAIRRAASEEGVDPAYMLAVAERESNFNTRDHASKTIFGAFQMTKGLRQTYGGADFDTDDIYKQARMFAKYTKQEVEPPMRRVLGRDPSPEETYLGHHAGPGRASRMLSTVAPGTPVTDIFTPYELSLNPHIVRAGTNGAFTSNTLSDMSRRISKYSGGRAPEEDFAQYGVAAGGIPAKEARSRFGEHYMLYGDPEEDFAKYGIAGGAPAPAQAVASLKTPVAPLEEAAGGQLPMKIGMETPVVARPPAAPVAQQTATAEPEPKGGIPEISVPSLVRGVREWWNTPSSS